MSGEPSGMLQLRDSEEVVTEYPIDSWFVEPGADSPNFFQVTVDHISRAGAIEGRVHVPDTYSSEWTVLPETVAVGLAGTEFISKCDACGCEEASPVGVRHGLTMQRCADCGLVYTSPRPSQSDVLIRYNEDYFHAEYLVSQEETPAQVQHWDNLLNLVDDYQYRGASLFEIGFGGGGLLERARVRGWDASGSDVNAAAVKYAQDRGLRAHHENVDEIHALSEQHDCVISEMSLEHMRYPRHAIELAADSLRPGGCLLVYTVCSEGRSFREEGMASYLVGPAEHLFLFSADSLTRMATAAGLELKSVWVSPSGDDVGFLATKPLGS